MLREISIVVRSLLRRPGFAAAVILTLGLGLGANAALFSLVDAVMLRPLPYDDPQSLVSLMSTVQRDDGVEQRSISYPDFLAIRDEVPAFESVAALWGPSFVVTGGERAVLLRGEVASKGYFALLGVVPQLGPGFSDGPEREVVLSHSAWQQFFGSDPAFPRTTRATAPQANRCTPPWSATSSGRSRCCWLLSACCC